MFYLMVRDAIPNVLIRLWPYGLALLCLVGATTPQPIIGTIGSHVQLEPAGGTKPT